MSGLEPTRTYSNPTANDILRRMLDERGVEHEDKPNFIKWDDAGQYQCFAFETFERQGLLRVHCNLTPAQAIAATLGAAYEPPVAAHWDGDVLTLTIPRDPSSIHVQRAEGQPRKVYADESKAIAATLGATDENPTQDESSGTCHITDNGPWGYPYVCSACGASFDPDVNNGEFNYCPNCGRRIEQ